MSDNYCEGFGSLSGCGKHDVDLIKLLCNGLIIHLSMEDESIDARKDGVKIMLATSKQLNDILESQFGPQ